MSAYLSRSGKELKADQTYNSFSPCIHKTNCFSYRSVNTKPKCFHELIIQRKMLFH